MNNTDKISKLDMTSPDLVSKNIAQIAALFPNCIVETAEGTAIDFDSLRQELNSDVVEGVRERYRLEWPGKKEAIVTANLPTTNTLRPVRKDSVNFDETENLYIEGDNLDVLKILQESYLGQVKMIYIDPPYNTGNDFVYKDNFTQDIEGFKSDSGQIDEYNRRLITNPETSGRYHSDWLSMIYPRLKLARNLLKNEGVIFLSIDDNEVHNLKKICDEIFGEQNFVAEFIWQKRVTRENRSLISVNHEYVLCYSKDISCVKDAISLLPMDDEAKDRYKNPDNDPRGVWTSVPAIAQAGHGTKNQFYTFSTPSGREVSPPSGSCWRYTKEKMLSEIEKKNIWFGSDGSGVPRIKKFLTEGKQGLTPNSIVQGKEVGTTDSAKRELVNLFDGNSVFETPKPTSLINHFLNIGTSGDDIVLDFFAGTSPTAHAVMQLNAEDGGSRKFIMVQIPEITDSESEANKAGFSNICELGKERIRRAGQKISHSLKEKNELKKNELNLEDVNLLQTMDNGFRVYRLDESNMEDVYYRPQDYKQDDLDLFSDNIKLGRDADDLLTQILLDWGLPLSLPIEKLEVLGKVVYNVASASLMACFDSDLDEEFAKQIGKYEPMRVVFRDSSFKNDTAKENVKQLFKQLSPSTEMRVL